MTDCTPVIVPDNTFDYTDIDIKSALMPGTTLVHEVVVVDDDPSDSSVRRLCDVFQGNHLMSVPESGGNIGFAVATALDVAPRSLSALRPPPPEV